MPDLPEPLTVIREAVESRLNQLLADCCYRWDDLGDAGEHMLDAASQALGGGKRMRAVLGAVGTALLAPHTLRPQALTSPQAIHLAAALELYQASALVHDDVMDAAPRRRGQPASHRVFARTHTASRWLGEAEDFGTSAAILLGDLLLSLAGEEMGRATATPLAGTAAGEQARAAFDAMTTEVALGQFLDVRSQALPLPRQEDPLRASARMHASALAVVRHKSARYSVQHPLVIGALLAGARPGSALLDHLRDFGEEIGIAFQLRDDDLGVYGDPALTGKPAGDDLREGKRTVMLALAWGRTDEAGRRVLEQVLANRAAGEAEVSRAAQVIEDCGARAAHEKQIQAHRQAGYQALERLRAQEGLNSACLEDLETMALVLTERST
ncbi:polyprenyl synthetase family protein [Actinomyces sp. 2119]|uniref:Polyprenyl synthetase family protein n=1 Tax=Actinomyces lilanjuaniae TaxID=2321394 RepID=A0ABN5PNL7_9ACTO|nr:MULTISPECIES: polyprenyl synthetase family protein [Actinomyces]AYD89891.1 polyprenyl synthetase family protein [Actinomyces lilanjuaniae]RJF44880.1 polyprenyl synthetase family protein [Actinomyces sp. 2119]